MCYNNVNVNYHTCFISGCYLPICSHLGFRSFKIPTECKSKPLLKKDKKITNKKNIDKITGEKCKQKEICDKEISRLKEENRKQKEICDKESGRLKQEIKNFKSKITSRTFKITLSKNGKKTELKSNMNDNEFRELGLDPATMKKIFEGLAPTA